VVKAATVIVVNISVVRTQLVESVLHTAVWLRLGWPIPTAAVLIKGWGSTCTLGIAVALVTRQAMPGGQGSVCVTNVTNETVLLMKGGNGIAGPFGKTAWPATGIDMVHGAEAGQSTVTVVAFVTVKVWLAVAKMVGPGR
jgi:hypothetical protein